MNVDYVPVADLTSREAMIARQKEIRRRQEEKARLLVPRVEPLAAPVEPVEPPPVAAAAPQITVRNDALARMPNAIIRRIAAEHGVSFEDIIGTGRSAHLFTARKAAILAVREAHPTISHKRLGRIFGGRDHATILNALGFKRRATGTSPKRTGAINADAPAPMQIIEETARKYGVSPRDVIGRCYRGSVSLARYEAVSNIRAAHPQLTARRIGEIFDGRSDDFAANCSVYMRRAAA